jgi:hypothetical protein
LIPVSEVLDLDFAQRESSASVTLVRGELQAIALTTSNFIVAILADDVGELSDALEDNVNQLYVERRR